MKFVVAERACHEHVNLAQALIVTFMSEDVNAQGFESAGSAIAIKRMRARYTYDARTVNMNFP